MPRAPSKQKREVRALRSPARYVMPSFLGVARLKIDADAASLMGPRSAIHTNGICLLGHSSCPSGEVIHRPAQDVHFISLLEEVRIKSGKTWLRREDGLRHVAGVSPVRSYQHNLTTSQPRNRGAGGVGTGNYAGAQAGIVAGDGGAVGGYGDSGGAGDGGHGNHWW
ncbi:hypothetical protein MRB53_039897 [Persea americana]|nr:hypothetical protein MRB53_039897 [Persea americana]